MCLTDIQLLRRYQATDVQGIIRVISWNWNLPRNVCIRFTCFCRNVRVSRALNAGRLVVCWEKRVESFRPSSLSPWRERNNNIIIICILPYMKFIAKILEIKLEYWLPGITIGASGTREQEQKISLLLKLVAVFRLFMLFGLFSFLLGPY